MQESQIRSYGHQAFDGSGGFGGGGHGGMNMDDIFSQFGDILVVPLVVVVGAEAEESS
jgi:DnaJ-class molecular chaperone